MVDIVKVKSIDELYCHYDSKTIRQDCCIEIDRKNNTLRACYVENEDVESTVNRFVVPIMTPEHINELMHQMRALADALIRSKDPDELMDNIYIIESLCDEVDGDYSELQAAFWLTDHITITDYYASVADYKISSLTTDDEIDLLTDVLTDIALEDYVLLFDLKKTLRDLRDRYF